MQKKGWQPIIVFLICMLAAGVAAPNQTSVFASASEDNPDVIETPAGKKNGFYTENSKRFYYKNGVKVKGKVLKIGSDTYCFGQKGVMRKNVAKKTAYATYYFGADGKAVKNKLKRTAYALYYFGANAKAVKNKAVLVNGNVYYFGANAKAAANRMIKTKWAIYYIGADNKAVKNQLRSGYGYLYYFGANGKAIKKKWQKVGNYTYYFDENAHAKKDAWVGERYVDENGHWIPNRVKTRWDELLETYFKVKQVKQLLFVKYLGGSNAEVLLYQKKPSKWECVLQCSGYVGQNGIDKQRQGDRKTPTGTFNLTSGFGILDNPGTSMPYVKVNPYLYWCADSAAYNQLVDIRTQPHSCSGEHLIDYVPHYYYGAFLDFNKECVYQKGAAIFLHCTGPNPYTAGCIAVSQANMITILRTIEKGSKICIYRK